MERIPKFTKNDKIEFVLRDTNAKSGYSHHCGYCKRSYERKRLFHKSQMLYDIVEVTKEGRLLWHGVPESDIIGIVEKKRKELRNEEGSIESKQ